MPIQITANTALPIGKRINIDIQRNGNLAAPTGFAVTDVNSMGFRLDTNNGPAGSTTMFEYSLDELVWTIAKNTSDDFAVIAGLKAGRKYYVRAHYIVNGQHSQYATATVNTPVA